MSRKIAKFVVCIAALMMVCVTPKLLRAADEVRQYEQSEVEQYKKDGTYPVKEGFVFAGWYEDKEYTTPVIGTIPEDGAWPKFVDEKVLTVKGQVTAGTTVTSGSTDLRLVTAVDSAGEDKANYQKVGFKIEGAKKDLVCNAVYKSLTAYTKFGEMRYTAKEVFGSDDAAYFATKRITGIPNSAFGNELKVTPYWITMDGTKVLGQQRTMSISNNLPIGITVDESCLNEQTEFIKITADQNVTMQLIVNGDESAPNAITLSQNDTLYEGTFYISSVINKLNIGENTFTIRAIRTNSDETTYTEEKIITYNSTGFMYVRNTGTLTTITDDNKSVLQYTPTDDWEGLGSKYVSVNNTNGAFFKDGIKYMTLQVKLTSGNKISFLYDVNNTAVASCVNQPIKVGELSTFVDDNGKAGKLVLNQWVTLKLPLSADANYSYRNLNLKPDGTMLIKNVQYKKDAYQSLPAVTLTEGKSNDQLTVEVGKMMKEVQLIVNGQEEKAMSLPIESLAYWSNKPCRYGVNLKLSTIINTLPLGENTFTIKASDGATATITYNNTGFLYVQTQDDSTCGTLTVEEQDGEKVLKYVRDMSKMKALGSKYIGTSTEGLGDFVNDGIKYVRMTVKIPSANSDNKLLHWCDWTNGSQKFENDFVTGDSYWMSPAMAANEWITITYPLYNQWITEYKGWTLFYLKPTTGTIYVKDIQYLKDTDLVPQLSIESAASTDYLKVSMGVDAEVELLVNDDENQVYPISLTKEIGTYVGTFDISTIVNDLPLGDNKFTVRSTNDPSVKSADYIYQNTAFAAVMNNGEGNAVGTLDVVYEDGGYALMFEHNSSGWQGLRFKYISTTADNYGKFASDGVKYIRMKVKVPEANDAGELLRWCCWVGNGSTEFKYNKYIASEDGWLDKGWLDKELTANQWVTITYPLEQPHSNSPWYLFYLRSVYGKTVYIKDIQYLSEIPATQNEVQSVNFKMPSDFVLANQYTTYYFDSIDGSDGNDGRSADQPKQTLTALNNTIQTQTAEPLRILIKAGSSYNGTLLVKGFQASEQTPLIIDVYGTTDTQKYAKFIGSDNSACVEIDGSNVSVSGLEATGDGARRGIFLNPSSAGAMKNVRVAGNYCHHININSAQLPTDGTIPDEASSLAICSSDQYLYERGGIVAHANTSDEVGPSWFENIWIEDNRVEYVARTGIWMFSRWVYRPGAAWGGNKYVNDLCEYYPHKNVAIRNNQVEYAGGDGILMGAVWNGWLEGNTSYYAQYLGRTDRYNAGIWVHSCNNIWFQRNEAAYTCLRNGSGDGQGFDIDIGNSNIYFRYNYSHHNEGGGLLFCNTATENNYYDTEGNLIETKKGFSYWGNILVQNNVFADNKTHEFTMVGNLYDLHIENNTVILDSDGQIIVDSHAANTYETLSYGWVFKNNIFVCKNNDGNGQPLYMSNTAWHLFDHNIFQGFTSYWLDWIQAQDDYNIQNLQVINTGISTTEAEKGYSHIIDYRPGTDEVLTGAALTNVKNLYDAGGGEAQNIRYYGAFATKK